MPLLNPFGSLAQRGIWPFPAISGLVTVARGSGFAPSFVKEGYTLDLRPRKNG
jgi:hypothetical protein